MIWVRIRMMLCDLEAGNLKGNLASERGEKRKGIKYFPQTVLDQEFM